jgi:hypothetical protein
MKSLGAALVCIAVLYGIDAFFLTAATGTAWTMRSLTYRRW